LLSLDLKKDAKTIQFGNLDEVLSVLETTKVETIPVEKIGFVYSQQNARKEVSEFVKWVLTDGQKFNHDKGFLNLDKQLVAEQASKLSEKFLTLK
jgi:ABC-type phosphate transport system substrate-binding protein